jgi:hypothetical protein
MANATYTKFKFITVRKNKVEFGYMPLLTNKQHNEALPKLDCIICKFAIMRL